jgi:uncharacterized protein Smg (DUF494 family)
MKELMKEKVVELLIFIMSDMHENKRLSEIDMSDLRGKGYTQSEISAAITWLFDNMPSSGGDLLHGVARRRGSWRVLHEAEKIVLSTESQGYLIQLAELGLLDEREMETVIERAMVAGFEQLSVMEVQEIVASVIFAREGGTGGANRYLLNSGDTIH